MAPWRETDELARQRGGWRAYAPTGPCRKFVNLVRLRCLPMAQPIEPRRCAKTHGGLAMNVLSLSSETREPCCSALAADEMVRYALQVQKAEEAGAEFARRQTHAGLWNTLETRLG